MHCAEGAAAGELVSRTNASEGIYILKNICYAQNVQKLMYRSLL
jgi:hypothetical protein